MKKGDIIIVAIGLIFMGLVFGGYRLYLNSLGDDRFVELKINGVLYQRIELNSDTSITIRVEQDKQTNMIRIYNDDVLVIEKENTYQVQYDDAYNILKIYNGGIQVIEDSSPYQNAVNKGFTRRPYDKLICLPYRLQLEIVGGVELEFDDVV